MSAGGEEQKLHDMVKVLGAGCLELHAEDEISVLMTLAFVST